MLKTFSKRPRRQQRIWSIGQPLPGLRHRQQELSEAHTVEICSPLTMLCTSRNTLTIVKNKGWSSGQ
jgi:hypothetical protein